MNTITRKAITMSLVALALSSTQAWAARILIQDNHQTVTLNQSLDCFKPAQVTIDTRNPEIYEQNSTQLQVIGDTVRAMLSYECPGLDKIEITGLIRGLNDTAYKGQLAARGGWLVRPLALEQDRLAVPPAVTSQHTTSRFDGSPINSEALSLTGLELGMSIAAAIEAVETAFEISPQYDPENGMMTLQTGGCPTDFEPNTIAYEAQSEWKCLKAWFSDKRIPALERVELIQVVNSDTRTIKQLLTRKYGAPAVDDSADSQGISHMIWHTANQKIESIQSLDANISMLESELVLTHLTLADQSTRFQAAADYSDIDLRL